MSPSPEFYLEEISEYKDYQNENINRDWERAKIDSEPLFHCNLKRRNPNSVYLDAILKVGWPDYYGFGKIIVPLDINRRTLTASQKFPGLEEIVKRNQESLGKGNLLAACLVLGIDLSKSDKEFEVTKGSIYFSTDCTNQHVTEVAGVVIERDVHAMKYFSWRALPSKPEPMYYIVSAKGFVKCLQEKFSTLEVSPGVSSMLIECR